MPGTRLLLVGVDNSELKKLKLVLHLTYECIEL